MGVLCDGVMDCDPEFSLIKVRGSYSRPGYPDDECVAKCPNKTGFSCNDSIDYTWEIPTDDVNGIYCTVAVSDVKNNFFCVEVTIVVSNIIDASWKLNLR